MERFTWEDIKGLILRNGSLVTNNLCIYTLDNYQIKLYQRENEMFLYKNNIEVAVIEGSIPFHVSEFEEIVNRAFRLDKGITNVIDYYEEQYFYYKELKEKREKQEKEKLEKLQPFMYK